jgi:hypothetical protein
MQRGESAAGRIPRGEEGRFEKRQQRQGSTFRETNISKFSSV